MSPTGNLTPDHPNHPDHAFAAAESAEDAARRFAAQLERLRIGLAARDIALNRERIQLGEAHATIRALMSHDTAPAYVHRIITAWRTGEPLDFAGMPVPDDVRARLEGVAPAGELLAVPDTQLTAEQEIRARALDATVDLAALVPFGFPIDATDVTSTALAMARTLATWITDGTTPRP